MSVFLNLNFSLNYTSWQMQPEVVCRKNFRIFSMSGHDIHTFHSFSHQGWTQLRFKLEIYSNFFEEFHGLAIGILLKISADKYKLFLTKADEHKLQKILIRIIIDYQPGFSNWNSDRNCNKYVPCQLCSCKTVVRQSLDIMV